MTRRVSIPLACSALVLIARVSSAAQIFEDLADPELLYDPSVRATAMGWASGAVFWGGDGDHWANPALLGYVEGIRYEEVLERFPTFTLSDGTFSFDIKSHDTARTQTLGYGGVGVALAGRPFDGLGGVGFHAEFSDGGRIADEVNSWSAAVSIARLIGTVGGLLNRRAPGVTRYVDAAFGFRRKTSETELGTRAPAHDWGLLVKVGAPFDVRGEPLGIEAAYGYSEIGTGASRPDWHRSVALHATAGTHGESVPGLPQWLRAGLEPLVSVGGGWNLDPAGSSRHAWGGEVAFANILFLRTGKTVGGVTTRGWGLALPIGTWGGFRYDRASIDVDLLRDTRDRSWSAWIDPLAIARARR